jgi:hypothetical protein
MLDFFSKWRYSNKSPVAASKTAPANSVKKAIGYLRLAALRGLILWSDISKTVDMISSVMLRLERVLVAGLSFFALAM